MLAGRRLFKKRACNLSLVPHAITLVQGSSIASLEWVCEREREIEKGVEEGVCVVE